MGTEIDIGVDAEIDTEMAFYTLFQFYRIRGHLEEFIEASNVGLARLQTSHKTDAEMPPAYWHLLAYQACALVYTSRYDLASAHFQRVMTHLPSDQYPFVRAYSKQYLGILSVHAGNFAVALNFYAEALAAYETLDAKQLQAEVLNSLGVVSNDLGEFSAARGDWLFRAKHYAPSPGRSHGGAGLCPEQPRRLCL